MKAALLLIFALIAGASCTILEIQTSNSNNRTATAFGTVDPNTGQFTSLQTFVGSTAPWGDRNAYDYLSDVYTVVLSTTTNGTGNGTTTYYSLVHIDASSGEVAGNIRFRQPFFKLPTGLEYGKQDLVGFVRDGNQWAFANVNRRTGETTNLTPIGLWNYQQYSSTVDRDNDIYYATIFVPTDFGPVTNVIGFDPATGKVLSNVTLHLDGQILYRSVLGLAWDRDVGVLFGIIYRYNVYQFAAINPFTGVVKAADIFPRSFSSTHSIAYDEGRKEYYVGMTQQGSLNGNYIVSFDVLRRQVQKQVRVISPSPTFAQGGLQWKK